MPCVDIIRVEITDDGNMGYNVVRQKVDMVQVNMGYKVDREQVEKGHRMDREKVDMGNKVDMEHGAGGNGVQVGQATHGHGVQGGQRAGGISQRLQLYSKYAKGNTENSTIKNHNGGKRKKQTKERCHIPKKRKIPAKQISNITEGNSWTDRVSSKKISLSWKKFSEQNYTGSCEQKGSAYSI
jgi:hypothetical protein